MAGGDECYVGNVVFVCVSGKPISFLLWRFASLASHNTMSSPYGIQTSPSPQAAMGKSHDTLERKLSRPCCTACLHRAYSQSVYVLVRDQCRRVMVPVYNFTASQSPDQLSNCNFKQNTPPWEKTTPPRLRPKSTFLFDCSHFLYCTCVCVWYVISTLVPCSLYIRCLLHSETECNALINELAWMAVAQNVMRG